MRRPGLPAVSCLMGWGEPHLVRGMFVKLPVEVVAWIEAQAPRSPSEIVADALSVLRELGGGPTSDVTEQLLREAIARLD